MVFILVQVTIHVLSLTLVDDVFIEFYILVFLLIFIVQLFAA